MNVLDKLQQRATDMQRPNDLWGPPLEVHQRERETGAVEPMGFATRREYEMGLTITARFWANQAQVREAREVAERMLCHTLYADVLAKLSEIEHAVMDGDGRAAMGACGRLRELITR